jgi:hypothetical protein
MCSRARAALVGAVAVVGACAKERAPVAAPGNTVAVTGTDFAFQAPDTIAAGLTTIRFANTGEEPHHLVLLRIDSGKTMADLQAALTNPAAPPPPWVGVPMGVAVIAPGDSGNATAVLTPGPHVMVCFITSPDGQLHVAKGMVRPLTVAASAAAQVPEPTADLVMTEKDYGWDLSGPLTAGPHTIRVENAGPQVHEVTVFQLAPGTTLADFQAWVAGGEQGPPPAKPLGGFIGPDVGGHGYFTATFAPGRYVLACYVPDVKDGKPHIVHGMVKEITVS